MQTKCCKKNCVRSMGYCIKCSCHKDKRGDCLCSFKLSEDGKITRVDRKVEESDEIKQSKHLMDLPDDVLIKILGYVVPVPSCEDCFEQRAILRLGRVNKRIYALSKVCQVIWYPVRP